MSKKECVWLDCDPGIDDAFAIILAYYSLNIELLGLSTVAGNCSLEQATVNALNVLNISGKIKPPQNKKLLEEKREKLNLFDCFDYGLSIPVVIDFFSFLLRSNLRNLNILLIFKNLDKRLR